MDKAFAVVPRKIKRATSYSPLSSSWTLYRPQDVAQKLGVPDDRAHKALEETGFNKAVRIREELIRWKERLRKEQNEVNMRREELRHELQKLNQRDAEIKDVLANVRNILRIPREAEGVVSI